MSYAPEMAFCSSGHVPNGVPERAAMQAGTGSSYRRPVDASFDMLGAVVAERA